MNIYQHNKVASIWSRKCYIILEKTYIIHTFPKTLRFLCLSSLKCAGDSPVIFLN